MADTSITPAPVAVPEADLDDLRDRLRRTRWPEAETVDDWSQGVPLAYVRELCAHWADAYDWRATEARLNSLGPVRTTIDGLGIHALHVPSPVPGALPLVVTHGWPGSVVEFLDVVGPLTDPAAHGGDPADAFHLVVPSLPGYGFSDRPAGTGWGVEHVADAWVTLMTRLGYERFGAQGGDWGAAVTTALGERHADRLVGVHLNMPVAGPAPNPWPEGSAEAADAAAEEQVAVAEMGEHRRWGTGYSRQQSTRPQTLGYGLVDSPAGQCAWIVEKFWAWTDCDGHPENVLTRDERVSVCVQSDEWNGAYVQIDGRAEVLDLPDALEPLVDYYRGISGEHPDWDEYRQAMRDQGKSLLRVTPTRWGPVATGGFPPELAG